MQIVCYGRRWNSHLASFLISCGRICGLSVFFAAMTFPLGIASPLLAQDREQDFDDQNEAEVLEYRLTSEELPIHLIGLNAGLLMQGELPLELTKRNLTTVAPSAVLGLSTKTQSHRTFGSSWLAFALGPYLGYSSSEMFYVTKLATRQLLRLGPPLDPRIVPRPSQRTEIPQNAFAKALRPYLGFHLQMDIYSAFPGITSPETTRYHDLRSNLVVAIIYNASSENTLLMQNPQYPPQMRSQTPSQRNLRSPNQRYQSWGLIIDVFSAGIADRGEAKLLDSLQLLLGDRYSLEFFFSSLYLSDNLAYGHRIGRSISWHLRLTTTFLPLSRRLLEYGDIQFQFEFFINYSWRWS